MENTFRLEFNEEQQNFHYNYYTGEEGANGWFTIFEHCTDIEFKVYESFVNRVHKKNLTKKYLLKCATEVKQFTNNLLEYRLTVNKS